MSAAQHAFDRSGNRLERTLQIMSTSFCPVRHVDIRPARDVSHSSVLGRYTSLTNDRTGKRLWELELEGIRGKVRLMYGHRPLSGSNDEMRTLSLEHQHIFHRSVSLPRGSCRQANQQIAPGAHSGS